MTQAPDPITRRYRAKANVALTAWRAMFGALPSKNALCLALAIGEHETRLGDANRKPGIGFNWGAVHKRRLTPDEIGILAANNLRASDGAGVLEVARSLLKAGRNERLGIDSSPTSGKYFVWFWSFDREEDAARKFFQTLLVERPTVRAIIDTATPEDVARAMYKTGYYEGYSKDPDTNIREYGTAVERHFNAIYSALPDWIPTPVNLPPGVVDPVPLPLPALGSPLPLAEQTVAPRRSSSSAQAAFAFGLLFLGAGVALARKQ